MSTTAICFRCGAKYGSDNPDDLAGDGKCKECTEISKKIAFEVDIKMAEKRRAMPVAAEDRMAFFDRIEKQGGIYAKELGIG